MPSLPILIATALTARPYCVAFSSLPFLTALLSLLPHRRHSSRVPAYRSAANVEAFSPLHISAAALQLLLERSPVRVAAVDIDGEAPPPVFEKSKPCDCCTVVLHGRLHVVCGSEGFESDRGPWTVLGAPTLRQAAGSEYVADFTARVMETSRLLHISRAEYEQTLRQEAESIAAAVRAAACEHASQFFAAHMSRQYSAGSLYPEGGPADPNHWQRALCTLPVVGGGGGSALSPRGAKPESPVQRVACTFAPELARAYTEGSGGGGNRGGLLSPPSAGSSGSYSSHFGASPPDRNTYGSYYSQGEP